MTIFEGINYFEEIIEDCKKSIEAEDGLPGLYYDDERVKNLKKSIEIYQQFIDWLKELEQHREFFRLFFDLQNLLYTIQERSEEE